MSLRVSALVTSTLHARKEWISDCAWDLIEKKRSARLAGLHDEYKQLCKQSRAQLRKDRQHWADEKAAAGEAAMA